MISVQEAQLLILNFSKPLATITLNLYDALSYALANDLYSPIDFPSFNQSAMDGYAFRFEDWQEHQALFIEQEIQAGENATNIQLKQHEAIRIFTGAMLPPDADTIVMQEHVDRTEHQIQIKNNTLQKGANVRLRASQTQQGTCIATKGTKIHAGTASFLAGLGIHEVEVFSKPKCTLLTTGKELVIPGFNLQEGQIFESNSYAIKLGLQELGIELQEINWVDDTKDATYKAIEEALLSSDVLIITGGISVGDYDFVFEALTENGVECIFHKVKQKPGKPIYFGKKNKQLIFGLPGNPASVMTCFYEYVVPCLRSTLGYLNPFLTKIYLPLAASIEKKSGLTHFLKARLTSHGVEVLQHQESYKMNSFAEANCLVQLQEEDTFYEKGTIVEVHLLAP